MNRDEFISYLEDYNVGDMEKIRSHYCDDVIFENYGNRHVGEDVFNFMAGLMEMLSTKLIPELILVDGEKIGLFGEMELLALRDQVNPALGSMKKGERKSAKTFVFYETAGSKIRHVRIAGWPGVDLDD